MILLLALVIRRRARPNRRAATRAPMPFCASLPSRMRPENHFISFRKLRRSFRISDEHTKIGSKIDVEIRNRITEKIT